MRVLKEFIITVRNLCFALHNRGEEQCSCTTFRADYDSNERQTILDSSSITTIALRRIHYSLITFSCTWQKCDNGPCFDSLPLFRSPSFPFLGLFVSAPSSPFEGKNYVGSNEIIDSGSFETRVSLAINQFIYTIRVTTLISEQRYVL